MSSEAWKLEGFLKMLESWGFVDLLLPFLLIFAIFFALFQKTKIFGDRKNINVTIALAISLLIVIPHVTGVYPAGFDPVAVMNSALPSVSIVVIAVVMLLILIGVFGGEATMFGVAAPTWIAILSILAIIFIFGGAAGWWGAYDWFEAIFGSDAVAIIVMLLVFGIIISFVTGSDVEERVALKRVGIDFSKLFGGKKE